eukprot:jgi/Botrbrau1/10666/Bobra.53_2s0022.2
MPDALEDVGQDLGLDVEPTPATLRLIQDKLLQKEHFVGNGVPVAPFLGVRNAAEALDAGKEFGYPFMLKSRRSLHMTGRNERKRRGEEARTGWRRQCACWVGLLTGLVCEKWVPFIKFRELASDGGAVAIGGSPEGRSVPSQWGDNPPQQHLLRDGGSRPGPRRCHLQGSGDRGARPSAASKVRECLGVEMFLLEDGSIKLNEVAPRPHNSGPLQPSKAAPVRSSSSTCAQSWAGPWGTPPLSLAAGPKAGSRPGTSQPTSPTKVPSKFWAKQVLNQVPYQGHNQGPKQVLGRPPPNQLPNRKSQASSRQARPNQEFLSQPPSDLRLAVPGVLQSGKEAFDMLLSLGRWLFRKGGVPVHVQQRALHNAEHLGRRLMEMRELLRAHAIMARAYEPREPACIGTARRMWQWGGRLGTSPSRLLQGTLPEGG